MFEFIKRKMAEVAIKAGLSKAELFGTEGPYPNPHGFETTPEGVPVVPRSEVKKGGFMNNKLVFGGGEIVSTGRHSFVARTDMGGTVIRKGQMFAFQNADPSRPALVYQVVETDRKKIALETQDVGYLAGSVDPSDFEDEAIEVPAMLAAE